MTQVVDISQDTGQEYEFKTQVMGINQDPCHGNNSVTQAVDINQENDTGFIAQDVHFCGLCVKKPSFCG